MFQKRNKEHIIVVESGRKIEARVEASFGKGMKEALDMDQIKIMKS